MSAYNDLMETIKADERVEGIVFGAWGWGDLDDSPPRLGYKEPDPPPVPFSVRGEVLSLNEAAGYMQGWSFFGGFGAPACYAAYIWTDRRVIWVTQYDGATALDYAPRNPLHCIPDMPGG